MVTETEPGKSLHDDATPLKPGTPAPGFELNSTPDQKVTLQDFKGRALVLVFYPADWSPVCGDQIALYNEMLGEFEKLNASIVGISVDGVWCHAAFAHHHKIHLPLLADFEPKGEVAKKYGVYSEADGVCERALFVISDDGKIAWGHVAPRGVNPGANGILTALEELQAQKAANK